MQNEIFMENNDLQILRHSTAHIMAFAMKRLYRDVKLAIGPSIENGFYYDFEFEKRLVLEDLELIEKEMQKIINEKIDFVRLEITKEEALNLFKKENEIYKLEIINDLSSEEKISIYKNNDFIDLCRGPHIKNTSEIKYFKLLSLAGAYWRGDEKNKMLQRIYGTAFFSQEELDKFLNSIQDALERDHRKLGKQLNLFDITDDIGAGLILWHPKSGIIRNEIEMFWKEEHIKNDYNLVYTPHIGKSNLWETSGHLDFYNENMYSHMEIDNQNYYIKPMNCPFHILIYKNIQHSYKTLPIRYAEIGTVYRYERSGVLHGLMRVRGFSQDDAHIICTKEQVKEEIISILNFCFFMLKQFGFENYKIFLSTRPKGKFVGNLNGWKLSEKSLEEAIKLSGYSYEIDDGGGAFYGPKIDIKIKDAIGREWQCSTIQFDFNLPKRFNMTYIDKDGKKHEPFMIHRALLGSIERFFGILIEQYKGAFPLWLSPEQVRILTINESNEEFAKNILKILKEHKIRVRFDNSNESLRYKIKLAQNEKIPYMIIIGDKEVKNNEISIRVRGNKILGIKKIEKFLEFIIQKIQNKDLNI